jgi:hypothetical protein
MISPGRSTLRPANIQTTSVKSWAAGQQSKNDVARLPTNGLFTTTNALLVQDGGIQTAPEHGAIRRAACRYRTGRDFRV